MPRTASSSRSAASRRILARDIDYSILHTTSGQIDLGTTDFAFERTQAFSFGGWCKLDNLSTSALFGRRESSGNFRGYDLIVQSDGSLRLALQSTLSNRIRKTTTNFFVTLNQWVHLFVTYDGSSSASGAKIYVNGLDAPLVTNDNTLTTTIVQSGVNTNIGARNNGGTRWEGLITDIHVYTKELTATEVAELYYSGQGTASNLYAEYLYTAGSGTTLTDSSGNGRDGTITSLSWTSESPLKARTAISSPRDSVV